MSNPAEAPRRAPRRLFAVLLTLSVLPALVLIADRRLPRGHQARIDYELQYALLCSAGTPGSVPLWLPYTAHGIDSSRALSGVSGLLPSVLLLTGPLLRGWNYLPLHHLGLLLEEILLLTGCWLLARRLFASPAAAFVVGVSAAGSAFALDHAGLNIHAVFALPLQIHLIHRWIDRGSRRDLLLAGNLAAIQALGSPPGLGLVSPTVLALYVAGRRWILREPAAGGRAPGVPVIAGIVAGWIPALLTSFLGRHPSPPAPSFGDVFVVAGLANPLHFAELAVGVSPSLDWTLFCGAFTLGLALVAILTSSRDAVARLVVFVPAGLLLLGGIIVLAQACLPPLRSDRPLPVGIPLLRLLVIFLAGAGVDRCVAARPERALRIAGGILAGVAALLAALASGYALQLPRIEDVFGLLVLGEPAASTASAFFEYGSLPERVGFGSSPNLLGASALSAALAGGVLLLWGSRPRTAPLALGLALLLHPLDLMGWKFRMSWMETFAANPVQQDLQRIVPAPFPHRRLSSLAQSERRERFHRNHPGWTTPPYVPRATEEAQSPGYWFADLSGSEPPEKLQFFTAAHSESARPAGPDDPRRLYLERSQPEPPDSGTPNERFTLRYQVEEFDANHVRFRVPGHREDAWILYADGWDPSWRARVDGAPTDLFKANRSYKAVSVGSREAVVEFRFHSPLRTAAFLLVGLNALFWIAWTLLRAGRLAAGREEPA